MCSLGWLGLQFCSPRDSHPGAAAKAEGPPVSRECRGFCIGNEGSNCEIRLKPVLSEACNRSCHKAILYSINQVFIFSPPPGRGGALGLGWIQQR